MKKIKNTQIKDARGRDVHIAPEKPFRLDEALLMAIEQSKSGLKLTRAAGKILAAQSVAAPEIVLEDAELESVAKAVKACTVLAVQAEGSEVLTIEGLAQGGELHPMQAAFREHHGLQCGFCTPGMIMTAVDMANRHGGALDEATIRAELEGNICRCTGYHNIVRAVEAGAQAMSTQPVRAAAE